MDSSNLLLLITTIALMLVSSGSFSLCFATNPDFCETQHKVLVASTLGKLRNNTSILDGAFNYPFENSRLNSMWGVDSTVYDGWDKINVDNATVTCKHITGSSYSVTFTVLLPPSRFVGKITVAFQDTAQIRRFTEQITLTSEGNNALVVHLNYNAHYGSVAIKSVNVKETSYFYPRIRCPSNVPISICMDLARDIRGKSSSTFVNGFGLLRPTIYNLLQEYLSY